MPARKDKEDSMESERYKRGWDKLREIDREQGERVIASLRDIAPDFATYLIEFHEPNHRGYLPLFAPSRFC